MSFHSRFDDTGVEVGGLALNEAPLPNSSQRVHYRTGYHKIIQSVWLVNLPNFVSYYKLQMKDINDYTLRPSGNQTCRSRSVKAAIEYRSRTILLVFLSLNQSSI